MARVVTELCNVFNRLEIPEGNIGRLPRSFHLIHHISKDANDVSSYYIQNTRLDEYFYSKFIFRGFFERLDRSPSDRWTAPTMTINVLHKISWFSVITLIVVHQDFVGLQSLTCTAGKCTRAGVQMQTDLSCEVLQEQHDTHASWLPRAYLFRVFTTYEGHSWLC